MTMTTNVLDPKNSADRDKVRGALLEYVSRLSSEQVVDLLLVVAADKHADK